MKKIWLLLVDHTRHDFQATTYAGVGAFLTASLAFNYALNFEDNHLDTLPDPTRFAAYLAWFLPVITIFWYILALHGLWSFWVLLSDC